MAFPPVLEYIQLTSKDSHQDRNDLLTGIVLKRKKAMEHSLRLDDLNEQQRRAVTFGAAPLLVLAGPGSGKTRIITRRITWLVAEQGETPEHILAVTFTNRAAEEMRERLFGFLGDEAEGVWIHTFHAAAMRILRKFGDRIGIPTDFVILDEDEQRLQVARQLRLLNLSREQYPVGVITARIGQMKSELLDPVRAGEDDDPAVTEVIRAYEAWKLEHRALDFADLLRYAVMLLRQEGDVRDYYRHTLEHVLVDEYQDINRAQYELITLLAAPSASITAVADDDQTIYGWRGSDPGFIDAFIRHYNPEIIKLPYSYRCPPNILYGAQHLIAREDKAEARRRYMQSRAEGDNPPIYHYIFRNIRQEQEWLVRLIRKLIDERGYQPGDIAILYRTHRLAGPVEQTLLEAGFQVQRVRPRSFFDRHQAREVVRYLQMARALTEFDFTSIINFPVHQVDELTMVQLRRLAGEEGINLVELVRRADEFPQISPLTRHHLQRMMNLADNQLPDLESDAAEAVQIIFDQLEALRSPWRQRERDALARIMDATRSPDVIDRLRRALDAGRPLVIYHDDNMDARIAAFIFGSVLSRYLGVEAEINPAAPPPENALVVCFGEEECGQAGDGEALQPPHPAGAAVSQSVWAWRWAQQLLMRWERLAEGRYTVYDIETTGPNVRRDEMVEIGALRYEQRRPAQESFRALIRPQRGYIPKSATRVHGIRYDDVADAPAIEEVLPQFLDYIGKDTLVGHNIARFDNRFIDKACGKHLGHGFHPLFVDTLRLARRLLPDQQHYSLEHLSQYLGLHQGPIRHRAMEDLRVTADLFYLLTDYLLAEKEQEALSEYLPLVGLGLLSREGAETPERRVLLDGATRMTAANNGRVLLDSLLDALPPDLQLPALNLLRQLDERQPRQDEDDHQWSELRELFLKHVEAFRKYGQDHSLRAFLDYQALLTTMDTFAHEARPDAITMMTLHNAKGVEYPVVIIVGVEQENLPIWRSLDDPRKLNEERRVLYVGITRAKNAVYLFSTNDRDDGFYREPSRFAFEIPPQYIRHFRIFGNGKVEEIRRTGRSRKKP
jgi:DNA polymerase III epsilon subunit family exonuclease